MASNPWGGIKLKPAKKSFFTKGSWIIYRRKSISAQINSEVYKVEEKNFYYYVSVKITSAVPVGKKGEKSRINDGFVVTHQFVEEKGRDMKWGTDFVVGHYDTEVEAEEQVEKLNKAGLEHQIQEAIDARDGYALRYFFLSDENKSNYPLLVAAYESNVQQAYSIEEESELFYNYPSSLLLDNNNDDDATGVCSCRQRDLQPTYWALTISQIKQFFAWCKAQKSYRDVEKLQGYVNMYNIKKLFVVPLTRGKGDSIAVLMNSIPVEAALMISHAWGESVEEFLECLNKASKLYNLPDSMPVFFCLLSQYQPDDGHGLSVKEQIDLDPFSKVIKSEKVVASNNVGMIAVHTSTKEIYSRLWCVHEIDQALQMGVTVEGVSSQLHAITPHTSALEIDCRSADCYDDDDRARITALIEENGGFFRLNKAITRFRSAMEAKTSDDYWGEVWK